jgi:hypothetical protein
MSESRSLPLVQNWLLCQQYWIGGMRIPKSESACQMQEVEKATRKRHAKMGTIDLRTELPLNHPSCPGCGYVEQARITLVMERNLELEPIPHSIRMICERCGNQWPPGPRAGSTRAARGLRRSRCARPMAVCRVAQRHLGGAWLPRPSGYVEEQAISCCVAPLRAAGRGALTMRIALPGRSTWCPVSDYARTSKMPV